MSRRWRPGKGFDVHQLRIDWKPGEPSATAPPSAPNAIDVEAAASLATAKPVQRLRWDFRTNFPQPATEAIEAGIIAAEDCGPDQVCSIHEEHARQMLAALHDLDVVLDARRRGVDPQTGKTPTKHAGRERLRKTMETEPPRLERWYATLLATYREVFGQEATEAFNKAVKAWHAGIEVIAETDPDSPRAGDSSSQPTPEPTGKTAPRSGSRIIARLPVPKPLAQAVAAGHFGTDEQGKPIHPSADEVHAITTDHAELLVELIASLPEAGAKPDPQTPVVAAEIQSALAKYAEDFGDRAASQLEAYARREARLRDTVPIPAPRQR